MKFLPKGPINNIPASVQIMAWRRSGDKPLSGPMMVSLLTHVCVTRPHCVKTACDNDHPWLKSIKYLLIQHGFSDTFLYPAPMAPNF